MTDKEKTIKELKEALDSLDITNKYRLNLIRAIEYLQEEPVSKDYRERYKNIAQSDDFKSAYENKSLGEVMSVEGEEPVSEELEKEIERYFDVLYSGWTDSQREKDSLVEELCRKTAIHFAKWQAEQFEKNRLKHCNSITNEQAELEQGFIDQHLDKHQRMPTFLDAIEYGMNLQKEQMMAKAVDGVVTFDYYGNNDKTYGCIAHDSFCLEDMGLKDNDMIKMVLIKKD